MFCPSIFDNRYQIKKKKLPNQDSIFRSILIGSDGSRICGKNIAEYPKGILTTINTTETTRDNIICEKVKNKKSFYFYEALKIREIV